MDNEFQFGKGLEDVINRYSMENGSDTPDFILAGYLVECLRAFNHATREREHWFGRKRPGAALEEMSERVKAALSSEGANVES